MAWPAVIGALPTLETVCAARAARRESLSYQVLSVVADARTEIRSMKQQFCT
jgi:hypothetical protein